MAEIAIIDYGMGNLHSVAKAIDYVADKNSKVKVTNSLEEIKNSSHIVFPGQGAVSECMTNISKTFSVEEFNTIVKNKPFLGICMGLQVLMTLSMENKGVNCLNLFEGKVLSLESALRKKNQKLKIPHMGWNKVKKINNHTLWDKISDESYFYFVHSYFVEPKNKDIVLATTSYGLEFVSAVYKNNIVAVQFHPEKSSKIGLKFLENFIKWDGSF